MHGISLITIALVALFAGNNAPFVSAAKVKIVGSGASFPAGLYAAWMQQYVASYPQFIDMTYSSVGSGKGRTDTLNLLNTFGASDTIPSEANGPNNVSMVAVPVVAGAIAVAYNVPGVTKLQLTRQNVVDIFTQKIRTWGDAALVANNPSLAGNNRTIQVCVRGTNSGTTQNFLTALLKFDSTFPEQPSQLASWPLLTNPTPIKGETNEALAILVSSIPYSLAYIDLQAILSLAAAGKLSYADIQNQAGTFITPSDKSVTAAMPSTGLSDAGFGDIQGLTVDTKAATGYPISAFTFYLVRINQTSPDIETARWTFRYLWWTLTNGTSVTDAFTPVNSTAASFAVKLGFANLNDAFW
ncbi:hypothetical protein BJ742DRAFT_317776 [Cladochytrium replicatum]|nr:hypothetical protein BJ742DRAFT_317776 [Cladochytrium replicatum]